MDGSIFELSNLNRISMFTIDFLLRWLKLRHAIVYLDWNHVISSIISTGAKNIKIRIGEWTQRIGDKSDVIRFVSFR